MSEHTADILDDAADLIENNPWLQRGGWHLEYDHGLCLEGGIFAAMGVTNARSLMPFRACPAYRAVADYLGPDLRPRHMNLTGQEGDEFVYYPPLYTWNDSPKRTKQEVLDVLRLAAKQERMADVAL